MSPDFVSQISDVLGNGINIGAFALVGWLVRHTFTHTIPRLARDFAEAIDRNRGEFLDTLDRQRAEFLTALDVSRSESRVERRECIEKMETLHREVMELRMAVEAEPYRRSPR